MKKYDTFHTYERELIQIVNRDYKVQIDKMERELFEIIRRIAKYLETTEKYRHEKMPKIYIIVDSDFDGYSSAKVVYQFLSTLGVSRQIVNFVYLNCFHTHNKTIQLDKYDLLIALDTAYPNVLYKGDGYVWWIDHHQISLLQNARLNGKPLIYLNTQLNNNEIVKDLSCGLFTYIIFKILISKLNVDKLSPTWEKTSKLDAILSMISDMMPIHKYPAIIQGILESEKNDLYEAGKTNWCYDNLKYYKKYISRINNLIRMERFDLIEELIRNKGGEFIIRDSERMNKDRNILIRTYFDPLPPEWKYTHGDYITEIYQVPLDTNNIMRNHKGLLCSMKIPNDKTNKYIILSKVNKGESFNYSVRTNVNMDIKKLIRSSIPNSVVGGHKKAFGLSIRKSDEDLLKDLLCKINLDNVETYKREILKYKDIADRGNVIEDLWNIAVQNEHRIHPIGILFHNTDFENIEVFLKRTVYSLQVENEVLEVISFDLEAKNNIVAVPSCKEGIYNKYKIEMLEMRG